MKGAWECTRAVVAAGRPDEGGAGVAHWIQQAAMAPTPWMPSQMTTWAIRKSEICNGSPGPSAGCRVSDSREACNH